MTLNLVKLGSDADNKRRGMTVSSVAVTSEASVAPLPFEHEGDALSIALPTASKADQRLSIEVEYAGVPADGLVISTNKHGARTFFGDNWPNRARNWLPTIDHVSDKATVEFVVTAPAHYRVIGSGVVIEESALDHGRRLTHYRSETPMATKVMVVGIARFAVDDVGQVAGIPISSWVYPEDRDAGFSDYRKAVDIVAYFTEHIGEFPYAKLANVQSTTRYGGMENAGNIFYAENSVTGTGSNEGLIAHEVAHQWFGDSVTEGDWYHIWLSEGFATYFTQLYFEHAYGRERMNAALIAQRGAIAQYARRNPHAPVIDTTIVDLNRLLSTNSYQKGGWVLHMLRRQVGTDAFWEGIRTYYHDHRDANALTSDLQVAMESASGEKLGWFFDQWLRRPGQPVIEATWTVGDRGTVSVTVEQKQDGHAFRFPLDIGFKTDDGGATEQLQVVTFDVTERRQTFNVTVSGAIADAELDPNVWLLMEGEIVRR